MIGYVSTNQRAEYKLLSRLQSGCGDAYSFSIALDVNRYVSICPASKSVTLQIYLSQIAISNTMVMLIQLYIENYTKWNSCYLVHLSINNLPVMHVYSM